MNGADDLNGECTEESVIAMLQEAAETEAAGAEIPQEQVETREHNAKQLFERATALANQQGQTRVTHLHLFVAMMESGTGPAFP